MNGKTASGSGALGGGAAGSTHHPRVQPSVAAFYDWSSNINGCVQVRQYHQHHDQQQLYYQQAYQRQQNEYLQQQQATASSAGATATANGGSAQVFPVRRPSKATLSKMRQYYNPGVRLLQAGRPADRAWKEAEQLTKGERHLALARGAAAARAGAVGSGSGGAGLTSQVFSWEEESASSGDAQYQLMSASSFKTMPQTMTRQNSVGDCQCSYDPRLYPVYTSRSQGPMCVVCKRRRRIRQRDESNGVRNTVDEEDEGATMAPPSTPKPVEARAKVAAVWDGDRRATTLDIFLPNAEREPASPLPRPSTDSARSQRTLSSPEPPSFS
uniref:Uncharacterized protein n=1 Tax=Macrostomum lignano TaxID=282301 RepID=A0A1I8GWW6_9PLAT